MSSDTYEILALKYAELGRAQALRELHRCRRPRQPPPHRLLRLGHPQRQAHHRRRHGLRRGRRRQARPQGGPGAGRRARADRHCRRQRGAGCRHPPALRPCRHARRLSQGALPSAGGRDGLRHRSLHVPQLPALPVHGRPRVRHGARTSTPAVSSFHDGDAEVAPGVTVHKIGGHSRGLQCVRVATATGPVVLASDSSHYYENFEKGKVFPITIDIADVLDGYVRLQELAGSPRRVVPGHDPLVSEALSSAQQPDAGHRAPAGRRPARRLSRALCMSRDARRWKVNRPAQVKLTCGAELRAGSRIGRRMAH